MIKFFRKIRAKLLTENRVSKYLIYAIGEILLVMIGILLALQVNNWNDRQKVISKERELLDNVLDNMKTDSISLSNVISYSEEILRIHQDLIDLANEQISENEVGNIDLIRKSEPSQMITSINNPDLPNQLLDQELKHLILDYYLAIVWYEKSRSDNNYIIEEHMRPMLARKELLNFGFEFMGVGNTQDLINKSKFFEAFKDEEIKQYLFESRLKQNVLMSTAESIAEKNAQTRKAIQDYINK